MPEMRLPIRTAGIRLHPALIIVLMGAALGGCSGGDFGRTRGDFRNDDMHRWLGAEATGRGGLKASAFPPPENEPQLSHFPLPLNGPPHSGPALKGGIGDYQPLPPP